MSIISDSRWRHIRRLMPPTKHTKGGRPPVDDRQVLEGILWMLKNGATWRTLPTQYGIPSTCWRRFAAWQKSGTWHRIWKKIVINLRSDEREEWIQAFVRGKFVPYLK